MPALSETPEKVIAKIYGNVPKEENREALLRKMVRLIDSGSDRQWSLLPRELQRWQVANARLLNAHKGKGFPVPIDFFEQSRIDDWAEPPMFGDGI